MLKYQISALMAAFLLFNSVNADTPIVELQDTPSNVCGDGPNPARVSVRHIESGGIGYTDGYTSLDAFWSTGRGHVLPFVDLRGHIFDSGRFAFNGGLGLRFMNGKRIYGAAAYYDYREAKILRTSNQIGVSLESLGGRWDFRLNGYFPVGSTYHDNGTGSGKTSFYKFSGHHMILGGKLEFAMIGCNGEVGAHLGTVKDFSFYGAAGPYYFEGKGKNAYGGQARLNASYRDYIKLEISDSYDNIFYNNFQGQLTLSFPTGTRSAVKRTSSSEPSCSDMIALQNLMVQPVIRQEIIVLDKKTGTTTVAIDPITGLPLEFIFVNNTSSSLGTFESPFPTFEQAYAISAANNIFYIYPGNGNAYDLTSLVTPLYDYQQVLGAGIQQVVQTTLGQVTIPAMANGLPTLTADPGHSVLTIGNNNIFSGLNFIVNGNNIYETFSTYYAITDPIYGIGTNSMTPYNNLTVVNNSFTLEDLGNGVIAPDIGGTVVISNNTFISSDETGSCGIGVNATTANLVITSAGNTCTGLQGLVGTAQVGPLFANASPGGIYFSSIGSNQATMNMTDNTVDNCFIGITALVNATSTGNVTISDNAMTRASDAGIALLCSQNIAPPASTLNALIENNSVSGSALGISLNSFATTNCTIQKNNFSSNTFAGIDLVSFSGTTTCNVNNNITNNNVSVSNGYGIDCSARNTGILNLSLANNTAMNNSLYGVFLFTRNTSVGSYSVTNNTLSGNTVSGALIHSQNTSTLCLEYNDNNTESAGTALIKDAGANFNIYPAMTGNDPAATPPAGSTSNPTCP